MAGTKVIDADGHIIERTDELRKYLKSPFNKRGGPLTASEPWDRALQQTLPPEPCTFPGAPNAQDWLRLLDDHNIQQVFLYPTALGNVSRVREPEYAVALCQAYNDYVRDHYAKISSRLRPVAILPFQDPESAVVELRRAVRELGCRGAVVRTTGLRLPLGHKFYDPIYREAETLGCALAVHGTNGAEELASGAFETFTEVHTVSFPVGIFVQFSSMIYHGVPERFPKLRLAFLEIGSTWLPYWLDRMDEHWEKRGKIETPALKQRPSDCVRQHPIFFSFEAEETLLPETFKYVGENHFVYATDIPHWDCEFPANLHHTQARSDLSDQTKSKILYENVRTLYGI
jgi:predicted TIM-barrel fold metal-dependent hydrolase